MSESLSTVRTTIQQHMQEIAQLFKDPKITLIVRAAGVENADLIMTDDDLDEVIESIKGLKDRQVGCEP